MQTASSAFSNRRVSSTIIGAKFVAYKQSAILNWQSAMLSGPFQSTFAPGVIITHYQHSYKDTHFDQGEQSEREILAHKDNRPRQQKDRLDIEDQKKHGHDVVTH